MKIWAIGGGKGGIGKSFVITNLAVSLSKKNKKVLIVDFDFGGANLHTCLGAPIPQKTLSDYFTKKVSSIDTLISETGIANLSFISGANDLPVAAELKPEQISLALTQLKKLPYDYLLLDLGAGTHQNTLEAFILADNPIVVITPEPTAIENAYRFIKSTHYLLLKKAEERLKLSGLVSQVMQEANKYGIRTPRDLVDKINELNPKEGSLYKKNIETFNLKLILNQARTTGDIDAALGVQSICTKYFGIKASMVGHIDHDNSVWQSVRKHRPVLLEQPQGLLVTTFNKIIQNLEGNEDKSPAKLLRTA
ncbi:MAG: AAA family ATPase [Oligoflexia bacterium]|nr:AAA family ATPase [Oligoflexia bacterium]